MNNDILNHINKGQVFAIIPARSGSKGIKDKNIRLLNGYPMIGYTIAAAKLTKGIDRVIVSTDSERYAEIARTYGAETPFLRPSELAADTSTDLEFMQHAINWFYENEGSVPEYWVHLRPTTPLRQANVIDEAISKIKGDAECSCLLSANTPEGVLTPYKWFIKKDDYFQSIFFENNDDANRPRQSYPQAYMRTVYVDILLTQTVVRNCLFGKKILPFEADSTVDIDDISDYKKAEKLILDEDYQQLVHYLMRIPKEAKNVVG